MVVPNEHTQLELDSLTNWQPVVTHCVSDVVKLALASDEICGSI